MIVSDASAAVEALVGSPSDRLLELVTGPVHAPAHLPIEVLSALRGLERGRVLDADVATEAWAIFVDLDITLHPIDALAERIWQLRHRFTAYDAAYLALAETLGLPLLTRDAKLAGGHDALVVMG